MTEETMNSNDPTEPNGLGAGPALDEPAPPFPTDTGYGMPAQTGLRRDPYATLGGIASGIAHRYMWDVVLVRLAFVLALIASGGTAILFYLIAWVVIPRAEVWPPAPVRSPGGGLSNRDVGIGLVVLGVLAVLALGGGSAGSFLVPLALVGGGIWLLMQTQRDSGIPAPEDLAAQGAPVSAAVGGHPQAFLTPPPVGLPVPPRSRRRKWTVRILLGLLILFPLLIIAGAISLVAIGSQSVDGFRITVNETDYGFQSISPDTLSELPGAVQFDNGLVEIDLRNIASSEWAQMIEPVELDVSIGNGSVSIYLPEGLVYSLDAKTENGLITQTSISPDGGTTETGELAGGADNSISVENQNPDLILKVAISEGDLDILTGP